MLILFFSADPSIVRHHQRKCGPLKINRNINYPFADHILMRIIALAAGYRCHYPRVTVRRVRGQVKHNSQFTAILCVYNLQPDTRLGAAPGPATTLPSTFSRNQLILPPQPQQQPGEIQLLAAGFLFWKSVDKKEER